MSMYDNSSKDNLYDEIMYFLENHYMYELLEIVADVIRNKSEA